MKNVKKIQLLTLSLSLLVFCSCLNTPVQRITRALNSEPEDFIAGLWIGQFEVDEPDRVNNLGRSINGADRDMYQQLIRYQTEQRWFRFLPNGYVEFFDRRQYSGRWRVAAIEGRTAVINISGGANYTDQKPLVFLNENTVILRPRLNSAPYARYGRVVFRRYADQPMGAAGASSAQASE
jgi:hypothetical protein